MGAPVPAVSRLRSMASAAIIAVIASGLTLVAAAPASADTAPIDPSSPATPVTVSSDPLPAPQINGVVWDQEIVGNTVYVAGDFTRARPTGVAAGVDEVDRTYLLAYDITTGALLPWAPVVNAQVRTIAASPDGTRLYAGGDFTTVNGATRNRIVAFDTATGAVATAFTTGANNRVYAIDATNTTVYFSGHFTSVSSNARPGFAAAVSAANGAVTPWAPVLAGGRAYDLVVSPDGTKVVIGGDFVTANGSDRPGFGLGAFDTITGASIVPWQVNDQVRNGGTAASIYSLGSDGDSFYGTGYVFFGESGSGNLETVFRASWDTGELDWVADCHGDTYAVAAVGETVYTAGHSHYCGNMGGFPQTEPWTFQRGIAFSKAATGENTADAYDYPEWTGTPSPSLLNWFPTINAGTFTGQGQGPWDVAADSRYAVYGGEFTTVNNRAFQGLARFAIPSIAPNTDGPRLTGADLAPDLASPAPGVVTVSWLADHDRDNENLTYHVIRDGRTGTPAYVTQQSSRFYDRPTMTFVDTGLTPGQTYTYRIRAIDPFGNSGWGSTLSITAATTGSLSDYATTVLEDQPTYYWRLGDATNATSLADAVGRANTSKGSGVTLGQAGAITGDSDGAALFSGTNSGRAISQVREWRSNSFALETWFRTTSTTGGKIVGFGSSGSGNSSDYDRHVYMNAQGKVLFGVHPGTSQVLQSAKSYNDNQWHHVVASLGAGGMELYVDGLRVGVDPGTTWGQPYWGYWRIGGDNSWAGDQNFDGRIDEVAVYPAPLTAAQVVEHYSASGREVVIPTPPADAYGAAVFADEPTTYWRLGEASGNAAADAGPQDIDGTHVGTYTRGAAGALVGVANTATDFQQGFVVSGVQSSPPTTYSTEAWFRTSSTQGGKITGFGNSATGLSSSYDRHVYLRDDGRLVFGTYTGVENTITTTGAFNDDAWHHVVATQSSAGMRLYVDGELVGTHPQASAQSYTGYWRAGGDRVWSGATSSYFDGVIDEVAVYSYALDAAAALEHYTLGRAIVPNVPPTAAFTSAAVDLVATFDASGSTDGDGTVVGYAWDFGDGETGTGATPTHEYDAAGTYVVALTVTDDDGAESTVSHSITVVAQNVLPTAAFTADVAFQSVGFDATGSTDADGIIQSYAWDFGDGQSGTGATPTHLYSAAGDHTVTLTVTDDRGGVATTSQSVTTEAAPVSQVIASDDFERTASGGWGTAPVGGAWTVSTPGSSSVSSGTAKLSSNAGSTRRATLGGIASDDLTASADFSVDRTITGGSVYAGLNVRQVGSAYYQARLRFQPGGVLAVQLMQGDSTLIANANLPVTFAAGQEISMKVRASGTSPTTIRAKVWQAGTPEPADWSISAESSAAGLQAPGAVGVVTYTSGSTTSVPVVVAVDDFAVVSGDGDIPPAEPVNQAPTAAFTSTVDHLEAGFDATGSSDPDGSIVGYAWTFGDGGTATGPTPTHDYTAPGDYPVTLTVIDDDGATATVTATVTATAEEPEPEPEPEFIAQDDFARTVATGWGSATTGGAWQSSANANYSVADGRGTFLHATAGTTRRALLTGVSATDAVTRVAVTVDKEAAAGQIVAGVVGRQVGSDFYQGRIRLQPGGSVSLQLLRGSSTILSNTTIGGLAFAPGDTFLLEVSVVGTSPTTISGKVWRAGTAEPTDWQATTTDATAAMQAAGSIGLESYISGSASNVPITVRFDDLTSRVP